MYRLVITCDLLFGDVEFSCFSMVHTHLLYRVYMELNAGAKKKTHKVCVAEMHMLRSMVWS